MSAEEHGVIAYCIAGDHEGEFLIGTSMEADVLPPGWALVHARLTDAGVWVAADEGAVASILCCPDHLPLPVADDDGAFHFQERLRTSESVREVQRRRSMYGPLSFTPPQSGD